MRFKERQLLQMANCEIKIDMEHYKHELQQIEVSESDKAQPERLLSAKGVARYRGGLGSIGWLVDYCCTQLCFDLSERRRRQNGASIQDMLRKFRSIPINHVRFMGAHDAGHANVEGGSSQQAHVILAVRNNVTEQSVPVPILSWSSKKITRVVRSSLAAETRCMATCMEQLDLVRTLWSQMTMAGLSLDNYEGALKNNRHCW